MEQAFKKHKVLSKRSIMREFTKSIASGEQLNFTLSNTNIELNRNFSKSSIDSMDIVSKVDIININIIRKLERRFRIYLITKFKSIIKLF